MQFELYFSLSERLRKMLTNYIKRIFIFIKKIQNMFCLENEIVCLFIMINSSTALHFQPHFQLKKAERTDTRVDEVLIIARYITHITEPFSIQAI